MTFDDQTEAVRILQRLVREYETTEIRLDERMPDGSPYKLAIGPAFVKDRAADFLTRIGAEQ